MLRLPELEADTIRQCSRCKCQSVDKEAFKLDNTGTGWHCPWCSQYLTGNTQRVIVRFMMIVGVILIFIGACLYLIDQRVTNIVNYYVPLNIGLFLLVWPIVIVPHMLIMLAGVRLLGGHVTLIRYGGFPVWYTRDIGAVRGMIGQALLVPEFFIGWYFPSPRAFNLKVLLLQLNLYLTSFFIIAILILETRSNSWQTSPALAEIWWVITAVLTVVWLFGEQQRWNQWLAILKNEEETVTQWHIGGLINYSAQLLRQRKCQDAIELCLNGLKQYPDSVLLQIQLGHIYSESNELELEKEVLSEIDEPSGLSFFQQAALYNNYGWVLWRLGDKTAAQVFIDRAYLLAPWNAAILNSKGWSLVEQGNINQGLELLFQSVERAMTRETKASSLGYAAIGLFRKQSVPRAVETLREAEKIAPQAPEVLQAKSELGHAYLTR